MNLLDLPEPARKLMALALTDPHAAAQQLRNMAAQLLVAAAELESHAPSQDTSGVGDRVTINVVRGNVNGSA